jgi:hypothetical protein
LQTARTQPGAAAALEEVEKEVVGLRILGSYPAAKRPIEEQPNIAEQPNKD